MIDVKKKLSSFLPSSARAQLQNVLTVEWDTHKTVLVQVPGAGVDKGDMEMEMGGMDRNNGKRENYGRIADDEEESEGLFRESRDENRPYQSSSSSSSALPSEKNNKKRSPPPLAPRPYYQPDHDQNPFDENSSSYRESLNQGRNVHDQGEWASFDDRLGVRSSESGSGQGGAKKSQKQINPWGAGGEWNLTPGGSPTSSRGTRESGGSAGYAEDPFR